MIFTTGARQFVVHDAFETRLCLLESYSFSFTPRTIVRSRSVPGAVTMTFFAPAFRCFFAPSFFVNAPVDSMTKSMPRSFHGKRSGSISLKIFTAFPSMIISDSVAEISCFAIP